MAGGGPTDGGGIGSNVPDDVDERDAVGARGLGTGSGRMIRPLDPDMLDSDARSVGGGRF